MELFLPGMRSELVLLLQALALLYVLLTLVQLKIDLGRYDFCPQDAKPNQKKTRRCLRGPKSLRLIPITRQDLTKIASLNSKVPTIAEFGHSAVKFCTDY